MDYHRVNFDVNAYIDEAAGSWINKLREEGVGFWIAQSIVRQIMVDTAMKTVAILQEPVDLPAPVRPTMKNNDDCPYNDPDYDDCPGDGNCLGCDLCHMGIPNA